MMVPCPFNYLWASVHSRLYWWCLQQIVIAGCPQQPVSRSVLVRVQLVFTEVIHLQMPLQLNKEAIWRTIYIMQPSQAPRRTLAA